MKKPSSALRVSAPPRELSSPELEVVAPGTLSDTELGSQLTAQYKRAVSGMREVLIFGAMLMQVENQVAVSARGHGGKFGDKGTGLKGWLATHAPEISRSTAYRFLGITKAVAEEYQAIVGTQIAGRYDLPTLVTADPATLPQKARLKQGELFDYVSGTSQRSLLDQFKGDARESNGGKRVRPNGTKRPTHAEKKFDDAMGEAMEWYEFGFIGLKECYLRANARWQVIPDIELANVADLVKLWSKKLDDICRARKVVPSKMRDWDKNLSPVELGLLEGGK